MQNVDVRYWRTDDMALATYLSICLETDPELEWEMNSCYFSYEETPELLEAVQQFVMGDALVEPREYNMEFAKIKKAVFAHPDCPPRNSRHHARLA